MSFDIFLELSIRTNKMDKYERLVSTNFKHMYWSFTQQLAHHSVAGCNMRPGDLLGSGTISGNEKHEFGSLLELTWGGQNPIVLSNGHSMKFLEDGDSINLQGHTLVAGSKVGFGDCEGTVLPALP